MEILINSKSGDISDELIREIKRIIKYIAEAEALGDTVEVSIMITDNIEIQSLNAKYRNIDAPTDVLSFEMDDQYLGDIVISMDKVIEQAHVYGHSLKRELSFLVVHGMLHLLGYDHIDEVDRVLMREKEEKILNDLEIFRE